MIDLALTRADLLETIGAGTTAASLPTLDDPFGPDVLAGDAHLVVRGATRDDLFAPLEVVLSTRFSAAPREELLRDLLLPLRSALGNAWKHGNREHPARSIAVEMVATPAGVVVAATDQGAGFDVALAVDRKRAGERYYSHLGAGLERLDRARSVVTWEDGGRTLVLCYRGEAAAWSPIEIAGWRLFAVGGETRDRSIDLRCVARRHGGGVGAATAAIVAGRLHADPASAAADRAAAGALYERAKLGRVRIPRPLEPLEAEPRLVRFDVHLWQSLHEYFSQRSEQSVVKRRVARVGRALGALHRSQRLIHGRFGTSSVQFDLAGDLYFYEFEACREGDPGLDLGGFAADLEDWASVHADRALATAARDAFLDGYRQSSGVEIQADRLAEYVALARLDRLVAGPQRGRGCRPAAPSV